MQKLSELFKDRPMTALDTAVYWVEYVARHGHILQSSAIDLNMFQQSLLDVYGFMALSVVTVLYLVIFLIRKTKDFVFEHKSCPFEKNQSEEEESKKIKWILLNMYLRIYIVYKCMYRFIYDFICYLLFYTYINIFIYVNSN